MCHFFMALRIDIFRDVEEFKTDMDAMLCTLASLPPADGANRVYYAGLKEQEAEAESDKRGVPLSEGTWRQLQEIGELTSKENF
jgi:LDH2 family malate/lactate/ureidoglycolate dehydrogenase